MAVDRRTISYLSEGKTSRWPRTSRRQERIQSVLSHRQPDLTLVLEDVHDPHNVSAVLRSCDAVGVLSAHVVYATQEEPSKAFARTTSASAAKWVDVHRHSSIESCYQDLQSDGFQILAFALHERSSDLYEIDLTQPSAFIFGNEMRGLSREAIDLADMVVTLPMLGMVESLNISVACAITLYEAMRQRRVAGMYDSPKLAVEQLEHLQDEWLKR